MALVRPAGAGLGQALRGHSVTLASALAGAAVAARPRSARAQLARPEAEALRGDLVLISGVGSNVVLLDTDAGAALVDSGAPESAAALVEHIADALDGRPVEVLFNTHWHPEHTGANDAFGAAGTRIVAHENTRLWMSTEYYVDWQDVTYTPRAPAALPNETFYSHDPQPIVIEIGGEEIEYGHLREAHTDGDIYVRFRAHNVIAAGGTVSLDYPIIDYATGGWIGGLIDATEALLALTDAETLIVPDDGPACARDHLVRQRDMLSTVRDRMEEHMRAGRSFEEMIAAGVTADFDAAWGDNAPRFVENVYGGLWWAGRLRNSL